MKVIRQFMTWLVLMVFCAVPGVVSSKERGTETMIDTELSSNDAIPPIDRVLPDTIGTATFALG